MHEALMHALASMSRVQLRGAASAPETPWTLSGSGSLSAETRDRALILNEAGTLSRNGLALSYQASWSFEVEEDRLWLGHARHGKIFRLLELVPASEVHWASRQPHLCGEDRYQAELSRMPDGAALLVWRTLGPKKNHEILRTFTPT